MPTAKVFWDGCSQIVLLPPDFQFSESLSEVAVRHEGEKVILEPTKVDEWPKSFWEVFGSLPEDFERP